MTAIEGAGVDCIDKKIFVSNIEIESWFMAGMTNDFPYVMKSQEAEEIFGSSNAELFDMPKEKLDRILEPKISGNRETIGNIFGEHINLSLALSKSATFSRFYDSLKEDGMIL